MDSKLVNKSIRKHLKIFFNENNFEKITDRKYRRTLGIFDYMIEIKSVGNYFHLCTGWPPQSICSFGGVFCNIIKEWYKWEYHYSVKNICTLDQTKYRNKLKSEPEKNRNDIWWIDDNSNLGEILNDLKESIKNISFDFFSEFKDKTTEDIIKDAEENLNGQTKYFRLYYLYKSLGMENETEENRTKFMEENKKLGVKIEL